MSRRPFDRFMLHVDLGTEEKLAGFTDSERLCHIVGVLAIAAKSPIRGLLIVGDSEATAIHIAKRADVSRKVAENTLRKLQAVGILVRNEEHGAWAVHAWASFNPPPKTDRTNAERQARFKARNAAANASSNGEVTASNAGEVEVEVEEEAKTPPYPPQGGRKRDRDSFEETLKTFTAEHFPGISPGYVGDAASRLRARGVEPTVEALRPLVEHWTAA